MLFSHSRIRHIKRSNRTFDATTMMPQVVGCIGMSHLPELVGCVGVAKLKIRWSAIHRGRSQHEICWLGSKCHVMTPLTAPSRPQTQLIGPCPICWGLMNEWEVEN